MPLKQEQPAKAYTGTKKEEGWGGGCHSTKQTELQSTGNPLLHYTLFFQGCCSGSGDNVRKFVAINICEYV